MHLEVKMTKTVETSFETLTGCKGFVTKDGGKWHLSISH